MTTSPQLLLVGSPVAQSKSPVFQNAGLRAVGSPWTYGVEEVDAVGVIGVIDRIRSGTIIGANVTMPHKQVARERCDRASELAVALGAVNTLYRDGSGEVIGTNTDVHGVARSIAALDCGMSAVVILGAGGAAAAAVAAVSDQPGRLTVVNRNPDRAAAMVERLSAFGLCPPETVVAEWGSEQCRAVVRESELVINATALGMRDPELARTAFRRLDLQLSAGALLDLIYATETTPFLSVGTQGRDEGGSTSRSDATGRDDFKVRDDFKLRDAAGLGDLGGAWMDGATMLVEQGARSFELWTGRPAPLREMYAALFDDLGRPLPGWLERADDRE